jgi:dTDP-4-dehydrorhamnose reductase
MDRLDDLDRFAELGIRALRIPVLWEHVQPHREGEPDWRWTDLALGRLQRLGIKPIVGLLHHGAGPRWIGVGDPWFVEQFARFARMVAERYPWVDAYTPVNEPLTTARFSGLYGHWYPHGREDAAFSRLFLAQLAATVCAMREIRRVNASAQLVQTEDLGKVASTRALAYQRDFENERRWLTWDILCGKLTPAHACWGYFRGLGHSERELSAFAESPSPPDVIGVNHYVTSERFLDERVERYALDEIGGNGREVYADVAQVQVGPARRLGVAGVLREAWQRYARPIAITECHLGCTREEQMRWLHEVWQAGLHARREGMDVRAVTSWALLGSYDWDSLVTRESGHYEPGAFDVRAPRPRVTGVAKLVKALAMDGGASHPVLDTGGWWKGPARSSSHGDGGAGATRPLLITGARGTLARALAEACEGRGLSYRLLARHELDIASPSSVRRVLESCRPWAVINAAGYVDVHRAERDRARCIRENVEGAVALAEGSARHGVRLVTYSTDLVFDGRKDGAYVESDVPSPLNVYGESKALAERAVLAALPEALVIRTSAFFGPDDDYNLVTRALTALSAGESFAVPDGVVTPTYVPDLAQTSLDLLLDDECGIWHLSNGTAGTWHELVSQAASRLNVSVDLLDTLPKAALRATLPSQSALASERGWPMPGLDDALNRYAERVRSTTPLATTGLSGSGNPVFSRQS